MIAGCSCCLAALAELDHLGIGAGGGQHRHRRRHDRQAQAHPLGPGAGEQFAQRRRRLGAALAHVEMRVGAVADKGVDQIDHAVGDIGVEVEGRDDRHVACRRCGGRSRTGRPRGRPPRWSAPRHGRRYRRRRAAGPPSAGARWSPATPRKTRARPGRSARLIASAMPIGCHGPAASIAATKPGVSGSIVGVGARASLMMSSPSR